MDRKLFFKLAAIGLLTLLLMLPLWLIEGQIAQRSQRQAEVRHNIARAYRGLPAPPVARAARLAAVGREPARHCRGGANLSLRLSVTSRKKLVARD